LTIAKAKSLTICQTAKTKCKLPELGQPDQISGYQRRVRVQTKYQVLVKPTNDFSQVQSIKSI